uniref:Uncharacterized protein n=1 Tax=Rhizophora mucronata TaxID=61149 RepID=A0A2P2Q5H6_RHIMU
MVKFLLVANITQFKKFLRLLGCMDGSCKSFLVLYWRIWGKKIVTT